MPKRIIDEEPNVRMYYDYGISEWYEKCLILTENEIEEVLTSLREGKLSPLVDLVQLPFPKFAIEYLSKYPNSKFYLQDPAFGYKLYLMMDTNIRLIVDEIRHFDDKPNKVLGKYKNKYPYFYQMNELLNTPFEEIPKISSATMESQFQKIKYTYLTQYIDFTEAKRLDMSIADKCERDSFYTGVFIDGFELEAKLDMLNFVARYLIERVLGLHGHQREAIYKIASDLGVAEYNMHLLFNEIFPFLTLTLGEFKNKIGFVDRKYDVGETREYRNTKLRTLDLSCMISFVENNILSELEKSVLSKLRKKDRNTYIAYKYIYKDAKKTADNLGLVESQVENIKAKYEENMPKEKPSIELTEEEKCICMYYDYGIPEWREKCLILTPEEQEKILANLALGQNSDLVKLAYLPFPKFIAEYFRPYPRAKEYLKDPAFGYKLYLMIDSAIVAFTDAMKSNRKSFCYKGNKCFPELKEMLRVSLDDILRIGSSKKNNRNIEQKFMYLTQYIDYEESVKLGLAMSEKFKRDSLNSGTLVDGYELEAKLQTLNTGARYIFARIMGLYGHTRVSLRDLENELGIQ